MKKILLPILIFIFCNTLLFSQKTEVRYTETNLDGAMKISSYIEFPNAEKKLVQKRWMSYLKNKNGKVKEHNNEYFSDNAMIPAISPDTLDLYSKVESIGKDVRVTLAVNRNGEFINNRAGSVDGIDRMLTDFAIVMRKEIMNNDIDAAENILEKDKKSAAELERKNDRLEKSIKDYKSKIADAERDIISNKAAQETNKNLMESHSKVVDDLKKNLKNIE